MDPKCPQSGFSLLIRLMRSRKPRSIFGRPVLFRDFQRQKVLNPERCHRRIVSGCTTLATPSRIYAKPSWIQNERKEERKRKRISFQFSRQTRAQDPSLRVFYFVMSVFPLMTQLTGATSHICLRGNADYCTAANNISKHHLVGAV